MSTTIASINLNKRLGNRQAAGMVEGFLRSRKVDILLAQEPWDRHRIDAVGLEGYRPAGGNASAFAWIDEHIDVPSATLRRDNILVMEAGWLRVITVYLSAYKSAERAAELRDLTALVAEDPLRPTLVTGDFNLAPRPEDGLNGDGLSAWTSESERAAFTALLTTGGLVDLTADDPPDFSFERMHDGRQLRFRCDLALASDYIVSELAWTYEHSVRTSAARFTDHSAIMVTAPVTLPLRELFSAPTPITHGERTAMSRNGPSGVAKAIQDLFEKWGVNSILDYGCGRGKDVEWYRGAGFSADGYDPHQPFGWSQPPVRKYDLVTVVFVLNVIDNPWDRMKVVQSASQYLTENGRLVIATRSTNAISREVSSKGWLPYNDGYISHVGKATFQKGISEEEMHRYIIRAGLRLVEEIVPTSSDVSLIVARNPAS